MTKINTPLQHVYSTEKMPKQHFHHNVAHVYYNMCTQIDFIWPNFVIHSFHKFVIYVIQTFRLFSISYSMCMDTTWMIHHVPECDNDGVTDLATERGSQQPCKHTTN